MVAIPATNALLEVLMTDREFAFNGSEFKFQAPPLMLKGNVRAMVIAKAEELGLIPSEVTDPNQYYWADLKASETPEVHVRIFELADLVAVALAENTDGSPEELGRFKRAVIRARISWHEGWKPSAQFRKERRAAKPAAAPVPVAKPAAAPATTLETRLAALEARVVELEEQVQTWVDMDEEDEAAEVEVSETERAAAAEPATAVQPSA